MPSTDSQDARRHLIRPNVNPERIGSTLQENGDPSKRRLTSNIDNLVHETRHQTPDVDSSISLEVDIMILDYLAFQTIESCLSFRDSGSEQKAAEANENIIAADSFLTMFKAKHSSDLPLDAEIRFRLRLLQLVSLTMLRFTCNASTPAPAALYELRRSNRLRARSWIRELDRLPSRAINIAYLDTEYPLDEDDLQSNRDQILSTMGFPTEEVNNDAHGCAFYGSKDSVSLLDVLPLFIRTSAARSAFVKHNVAELWMEMAAEFMLQACIEQYLVCGEDGSDAIDEAFAWGYIPTAHGDGAPILSESDEVFVTDEVNDMFEDVEYEAEIEGWKEMKLHYLSKLGSTNTDQGSSSTQPALSQQSVGRTVLQQLAISFPFKVFERKLSIFFSEMNRSIPRPVLAQLEKGQLDGMTSVETVQFLRETCGISPKVFRNFPG